MTTGTTLLLTSCSASTTANSAASATGSPAAPSVTPSASSTASPTAAPTASPSADPSAPPVVLAAVTTAVTTAPPAPLNGTAHNGLTISNGTRYVVMNGTTVDFGTEVRDLVWSPNGRKAAFVDGAGDLVVADPDGSAGHRRPAPGR
ncbi:hypothetical protein ACIRPK_32240 [Kitasatospora sp. NPDC101801]|uniref:hypothetical protein n=1 Tax=Kitasatospora sp. NPDC101801 TaxID=3364103 RepID=UPI0038171241